MVLVRVIRAVLRAIRVPLRRPLEPLLWIAASLSAKDAQRRRGFALGGDVVPQLVLEGVLGDVHLLAVAVLGVAIPSTYLYSGDGTSVVSDTYEGRERGVASSSIQPPRERRDHGYFAVGTHLHGGRAASGGSARDAPPGQTRGREELARRERRRHRTRGKVALPCTGK